MSEEQMRRALELIQHAKGLKKQLSYVLLRADGRKEELWVGEASTTRSDSYSAMPVPIPEEARRYMFRLWRKDIAQKFNNAVRELNRLGASHPFALIKFSQITGEPTQ